MGLHASYYLIPSTTLADFISDWHSERSRAVVAKVREESRESGQEFYIGTNWHVLDFIINPPDASVPELLYCVRGHEFPAPDGSIHMEPHLPSYDDEYWQIYTYVTAEEVKVIAEHLPLIDESEFDSRYISKKMKGVYHAPIRANENRRKYIELLARLNEFYMRAANKGMAVLINIG